MTEASMMQTAQVEAQSAEKQSRLLQRIRMGVAVGAGIIMLVTGCNNGNGGETERASVTAIENIYEACDEAEFDADVAADPTKYAPTAAMPKTEEITRDNMQEVVAGWFGEGPLGTKIGKESLAYMQAVVTKPAHDGEAINPNFNYVTAAQESLATYNAPQGALEAAQDDCTVTAETVIQTAEFKENWADHGEVITRFEVTRGEDYHINNPMVLSEFVVPEGGLSGIEVAVRPTSKDIDGFPPVLFTAGGYAYVKGVTVGNNGEQPQPQEQPQDQPQEQQQQDQEGNTGGGSGQKEGSGGGNDANQKNGSENSCDGGCGDGGEDQGNGQGNGDGGGDDCGGDCPDGGGDKAHKPSKPDKPTTSTSTTTTTRPTTTTTTSPPPSSSTTTTTTADNKGEQPETPGGHR